MHVVYIENNGEEAQTDNPPFDSQGSYCFVLFCFVLFFPFVFSLFIKVHYFHNYLHNYLHNSTWFTPLSCVACSCMCVLACNLKGVFVCLLCIFGSTLRMLYYWVITCNTHRDFPTSFPLCDWVSARSLEAQDTRHRSGNVIVLDSLLNCIAQQTACFSPAARGLCSIDVTAHHSTWCTDESLRSIEPFN